MTYLDLSILNGLGKKSNKHSLANRLLIYILLLSSCITLLITAFQLYFDYHEESLLVESRMLQIEKSYHDSLANAMWYLQIEQIESILKGINTFEDVHYVSVKIKDSQTYSLGELRTKNIKRYDSEVLLSMDGREIYVGSLSIESNLDGTIKRLSNKFYLILISQAIKTFIVSIFILLLVHYLITRHLKTITEFTKKIDLDGSDDSLELRRARGTLPDDELDNIVNAMNEMTASLKKSAMERNAAEAELMLSVARFDRWKASNFIGIIQSNDNGDIVEANDTVLEMLGYTRAELLDGKLDWTQLTPPEFAHLDHKAIEEASRMGYWVPFEKEYLHKDGHRVPIMLGGSIFNASPGEYIAFIVDLSERKKNEQRLELALKATESGAWDWNIQTGEVHFDRNWLMITGYEAGDMEPHISAWEVLVHPEDIGGLKETLNTHFKGDSAYYEYEYRLRVKGGQYIWSCDRGKVIERDENNAPLRMIGLDTNITQRRQHEEQLRRTQKMDALGKLTGGIAHDFNNILGVISGYSELLAESLSDQSKLVGYAQAISHASGRGAKLTSKLLGFTRVKRSDPQVLDLNSLLVGQQDLLRKTLTVRIQLKLNLGSDLWSSRLDSDDLEDAILNISINAMHAIEGRGELDITTRNQRLDFIEAKQLSLTRGDYVVLSIADSGVGMDKDTQDKIFEPFFSTKGEMGTGLGLSQVYGFVDRSNGCIKVYSEVGGGACFELYFPRYIEQPRVNALPKHDRVGELEGKNVILIVDDEAQLLDVTKEILQNQGYSVVCAQSGKKALDILNKSQVDLLISDVLMPEMNGYELSALVKERYPTVKIQLVSGYSDDAEKNIVKKSKQANLLQKPISSKDLLVRIKTLLDEELQG
ncbi:MAG: hypothetical protein COB04_14325 [Gammaproteobacteria bacterium]|nr:MAG: hypothetical protein COB04_14325 [Gammaproteobacteria bacterium]